MKKLIIGAMGLLSLASFSLPVKAAGWSEVGQYGRPFVLTVDTPEQIEEEIELGEMEMLAQLEDFPNTIEGVIFQPGAFTVTKNGAFEKAAWNMQESDFAAVSYEMELHSNKKVIAFNCNKNVAGKGELFKVGGHWFRNG